MLPMQKALMLASFSSVIGTGGGGGEWTPASTTLAAWYDISDISTLFQDTAGTTPVTTNGQTVKRINDKSGNGLHATNSTGWVYETNGGKPRLSMDGATRFVSVSGTLTDGSGRISLVALMYRPAGSVAGPIYERSGVASFDLEINSGFALARAFDNTGTALGSDFDFGASVVADTPATFMTITNLTTTEGFYNNTGDGPATISGTLYSANSTLAIGSTSQAGKFYGGWVSKQAYDATTRGNAQTFGAGKF